MTFEDHFDLDEITDDVAESITNVQDILDIINKKRVIKEENEEEQKNRQKKRKTNRFTFIMNNQSVRSLLKKHQVSRTSLKNILDDVVGSLFIAHLTVIEDTKRIRRQSTSEIILVTDDFLIMLIFGKNTVWFSKRRIPDVKIDHKYNYNEKGSLSSIEISCFIGRIQIGEEELDKFSLDYEFEPEEGVREARKFIRRFRRLGG